MRMCNSSESRFSTPDSATRCNECHMMAQRDRSTAPVPGRVYRDRDLSDQQSESTFSSSYNLLTMSDKYWFPSMSISDIVQALSNWGYSVSPEQLSRPSPDFVLGIYCACLQQVTSLTQDSLQEPLEFALSTLDSPVCALGF